MNLERDVRQFKTKFYTWLASQHQAYGLHYYTTFGADFSSRQEVISPRLDSLIKRHFPQEAIKPIQLQLPEGLATEVDALGLKELEATKLKLLCWKVIKDDGWVSSRWMERLFNGDYTKTVRQGLDSVLELESSYQVGVKPKRYRIASGILEGEENTANFTIRTKPLLKKFNTSARDSFVSLLKASDVSPQSFEYLLSSLDSINLPEDVSGAPESFLCQQEEGSFKLNLSSFNRLYTPFCGLPAKARSQLLFQDYDVVELDLPNSHPAFLTLLADDPKEAETLAKLAQDGEFYSLLDDAYREDEEKLLLEDPSLKTTKLAFFRVLNGQYRADIVMNHTLGKRLPGLWRRINGLKRAEGAGFYSVLQRLEGYLMNELLASRLREADCPAICTVYDSVIVPSQYSSIAEDAFAEVTQELLGFEMWPRDKTVRPEEKKEQGSLHPWDF